MNNQFIFKICTVLITVLILLSACGPAVTVTQAPQETSAPGTEAAIESFEGKKLTVVTLEGGIVGNTIQQLVDTFNERTGAEVSFNLLSQTDFMPKVQSDMATGTGIYDVIIGETFPLHESIAAGFIEPLDDYINADPEINVDDFIPTLLNSYGRWEGKLYGLPYESDVYSMYFRKDLFADPELQAAFKSQTGNELKVPETADEMIETARFFTKKYNPDSPTDYGFVYWGGGCGGKCAHWIWASRLVVYGGSYLDENNHPNINNEAGRKAMDVALELLKYSPPEGASYNYTEMNVDFLAGKVAMMEQWPIAGVLNQEESWLGHSEVVGKVGYAVPFGDIVDGKLKQVAVLGGWTAVIAKTAPEKALAYEFVKYATSEEAQKLLLPDILPSRQSAYNDQEFISTLPDYLQEFFPVANDSFEHAGVFAQVSRPPVGGELQSILGLTMNKVWLGELDGYEALAQIEEEWTGILQREGLYK